jgi:hypothetical protein
MFICFTTNLLQIHAYFALGGGGKSAAKHTESLGTWERQQNKK